MASHCASSDPSWSETVSLVPLCIRNSIKADLQCAPAELVYGTTLKLPGEFVSLPASSGMPPLNFAFSLAQCMRSLRPAAPVNRLEMCKCTADSLAALTSSSAPMQCDALSSLSTLVLSDSCNGLRNILL
ncbi:unnamed protein product [Dicrocoelium dendriticum]|nr:unnamed protein product [Dicrocoelium dendriticum]